MHAENLPHIPPIARKRGLKALIRQIRIGENQIVEWNYNVARGTCVELNKENSDMHFAIWNWDNITKRTIDWHTKGNWALVARLSPEQRTQYESERKGSTI